MFYKLSEYNLNPWRRKGEETLFLLAYKFRIFNAYDEMHFCVPIRCYRIVMSISYLLTFTSIELEFLKIIVKCLIKLSTADLVPVASAICHLTQFSIICIPIIALYRFMLLEFSIQP